jgi:glycosyltransferase involved in cell wall biosynthesis
MKSSIFFHTPDLTITHNEDGQIADKLIRLYSVLLDTFKYFEIIVVDNFSSDNTAEKLKTLDLPLSIVTLARLHSVQAALTAGVELAIGDYVVEVPNVCADFDAGKIIDLYRTCQQGHDFVFLTPKKRSIGSRLFYRLLNNYYKGQTTERFVSSLMTLSSRRGQNKTADTGSRLVNRNVSYTLTGLKCAAIETDCRYKNKRGLRENFDLMIDTLIFHTDYISHLAVSVALFFLGISVLAFVYAVIVFFTIDTTPGWATQFVLTSVGFGALFGVLAVICKYLSNVLKLQMPKNYTFSSVEKRGGK